MSEITLESTTVKACNGNHYELYSDERPQDADGWTYYRCNSCGQRWRSKTVTEYLND